MGRHLKRSALMGFALGLVAAVLVGVFTASVPQGQGVAYLVGQYVGFGLALAPLGAVLGLFVGWMAAPLVMKTPGASDDVTQASPRMRVIDTGAPRGVPVEDEL